MNKLRIIISSAYSVIITVVFVVVITILAELFVPLKDGLKSLTGHHWTSKSILSVLVYAFFILVFYPLFHNVDNDRLKKAFNLVFIFTILGVILLVLFFTGHHFHLF